MKNTLMGRKQPKAGIIVPNLHDKGGEINVT